MADVFTDEERLLWLDATFMHTTAELLKIDVAPVPIMRDLYDRFVAAGFYVEAFTPVGVLVIDKSTEQDRRERFVRLSLVIDREKHDGTIH